MIESTSYLDVSVPVRKLVAEYGHRMDAKSYKYLIQRTSFSQHAAHCDSAVFEKLCELVDEARRVVISENTPLWITLAELFHEKGKRGALVALCHQIISSMSHSLSMDAEGTHLWLNEGEVLWSNFSKLEDEIESCIIPKFGGDIDIPVFGDKLNLREFLDQLHHSLAVEAVELSREIVRDYL